MHPYQPHRYINLRKVSQVLEELLSRRDLTEEQTASALAVRPGPVYVLAAEES